MGEANFYYFTCLNCVLVKRRQFRLSEELDVKASSDHGH